MKWNKAFIPFTILFVITVLVSVREISKAVYIKEHYTTVSVRMKTEEITEDEVRSALEKEKSVGMTAIPEITAWSQQNDQEVGNTELGRVVKTSIIVVSGDISLTAPMSLLHGNYPYQEDFKGCVIDAETAYQLYGMEDAIGNTLNYKDKEYYVRGVVKTLSSLLILPGDNETQYTNLEFIYPDQERGEELAAGFLLQNDFPKDYLLIDSNLYGNMQRSFLVLPTWIFYFVISWIILRFLWKRRRDVKSRTVVICGAAGMIGVLGYGILLYQYTGNPIYIPEKLIPTRFSDFDYWSAQLLRMKEQVKNIHYVLPNNRDILLEKVTIQTVPNAISLLLLYLTFLLSCRNLMHGRETEYRL
ncbi:MAG: hypothetical protein K0S47_3149 [Herbinix sp.]|jgi:hypothetical protein|nr:hypothetical protein [Herbinix sp.]